MDPRRRVGGFDPNGIASACPAPVGIQIICGFHGIHISQSLAGLLFSQNIVFIAFLNHLIQIKGSMMGPVENSLGNLDPI